MLTDTILMVRPARFGYNEETAANNAFQQDDVDLSERNIQLRALAEFDFFVDRLRAAGVRVIVVEDTATPVKYDAVFPNNWFSTHRDGTLVTYPMFAPMRRLERREDVVAMLAEDFVVDKRVQLEEAETEERFLEGTGSMVLDRDNRVAYACRSVRTDDELLREFARRLHYEVLLFDAVDPNGRPIYHTNVMMALGEDFCVICPECIPEADQRRAVIGRLEASGKEVIPISFDQLMAFAGNMLQVRGQQGQPILVMSTQAYESLTPDQIARLERHTALLHAPLYTIETSGGGSARCMMAEIFLPAKVNL